MNSSTWRVAKLRVLRIQTNQVVDTRAVCYVLGFRYQGNEKKVLKSTQTGGHDYTQSAWGSLNNHKNKQFWSFFDLFSLRSRFASFSIISDSSHANGTVQREATQKHASYGGMWSWNWIMLRSLESLCAILAKFFDFCDKRRICRLQWPWNRNVTKSLTWGFCKHSASITQAACFWPTEFTVSGEKVEFAKRRCRAVGQKFCFHIAYSVTDWKLGWAVFITKILCRVEDCGDCSDISHAFLVYLVMLCWCQQVRSGDDFDAIWEFVMEESCLKDEATGMPGEHCEAAKSPADIFWSNNVFFYKVAAKATL